MTDLGGKQPFLETDASFVERGKFEANGSVNICPTSGWGQITVTVHLTHRDAQHVGMTNGTTS